MDRCRRAVSVIFLSVFVGSCAGAHTQTATQSPSVKSVADEPTLAVVKARGAVNCGVSTGVAGFSAMDDSGSWRGLDVDLCRSLASAIFGDATKVTFVPVSTEQRFAVLQSGEIDLLARNTVWTMRRDGLSRLDFPTVTFYDGQGFMVRRDSGISNISQLTGATVCVQRGTTTEFQVGAYSIAHGLGLQAVAFSDAQQVVSAYDGRRCVAYSADSSALAGERLILSDPAAHVVLPGLISKEPVAPVVRQDDSQWADVVRWVHFARLAAEEEGIESGNVDSARNSSTDPEIRRLLGVDDNLGEGLGLPRDWAFNVIKQVGNYAESFERNVGRSTPLGMARGANALWNKGGLQFAPPMR
jgi:general L-amino acid transport system substrate-binding protein